MNGRRHVLPLASILHMKHSPPVGLVALSVLASFALTLAAPAEDMKAPMLESFTSGEGSGFNAVYQGEHYTAFLLPDRSLRIHLREDGKNIGAPLLVRFSANEIIGHEWHRLSVVGLTKSPKPSLKPAKLEVDGLVEGRIRFHSEYAFGAESISLSGSIDAPGRRKHRIVLNYGVIFPATSTFPAGTADSEIERATAGTTLRLVGVAGTKEVPFSRILPSEDHISRVEAVGAWGSRRIILEAATSKKFPRSGYFDNYLNIPLYQGWSSGRAAVEGAAGGPLNIQIK